MEWRYSAAKDPATPAAMLMSLLDFKDCRLHLSQNPSSPTALLEELSTKEAFEHLDPLNRRMAVANVLRHSNTSPEAISRILEWTEGYLNKVFEGESPENVSNRLDSYFYPSAADNQNTPVKYLIKFIKSDDETTLSYVVKNPNLPQEFIDEFAELLVSQNGTDSPKLYDRVAENPNLAAKYFPALAKHSKWFVRDHIARNPSTPGEVLMGMLKDEDFMVRIGCLMNPNLPLEGLEYFANQTKQELRQLGQNWIDDHIQNVKRSILRNKNASEDLKSWVSSEEWLKSR